MIKNWRELSTDFKAVLEGTNIEGRPIELYDPINYILELGGKRVRPVLCLLASQLFKGEKEEAFKAALGIEIFHNFTLVHDDIMDEAPLRRGSQTVHEKWNRDVAILSGDVMFVKAYEQFCELKSSSVVKVLKTFNQTAVEVCEGQQLDMNFEKRDQVKLTEYLKMIELKTAVLLAASLKIGAMVSGASEQHSDLIYDFGINLGLAFQIQDDYLDAYADQAAFGKKVGGDILLNKKTFLLISALSKSNSDQEERFASLALLKNESLKIEGTIALFNELNIPAITKKQMSNYYSLAMNSLEKIDCKAEFKRPLIELAEELIQRKS